MQRPAPIVLAAMVAAGALNEKIPAIAGLVKANKGNQRARARFFTDNAKRSDKGVLQRHRIPGRNDKCVCGSGKKYKNCCFKST